MKNLKDIFEPDAVFSSMIVPLSDFIEQNGNAMTVEGKIRQLVLAGDWPIILTTEGGAELETCRNEQELRDALERRGIL